MSSKDQGEDIAFFLYLLPIVASVIYGVYEWAAVAHTSAMPFLAYAIVAKSQYLFLLSLVAICLAIIIEVRSANLPEREGIVKDNSSRLQFLAIAVLIISFAASISVANYNVPNAFSIFIVGRYPLIYAFFLVGISLLLSPKQILGNAKISATPEVLGLILLTASPVIFYLGNRVHAPFAANAIAGFIAAIIGIVLLIGGSRLFAKKTPKSAVAPKQTS
jgi:hypothetical protein